MCTSVSDDTVLLHDKVIYYQRNYLSFFRCSEKEYSCLCGWYQFNIIRDKMRYYIQGRGNFLVSCSSLLHKLIMRISTCRYMRYKMQIDRESPNCSLCNGPLESLPHIYLHCPVTLRFIGLINNFYCYLHWCCVQWYSKIMFYNVLQQQPDDKLHKSHREVVYR